MNPPSSLRPDARLRSTLLDYFIDISTGSELSDWLRDIGQDPNGTVADKKLRVRQNTKYLGMPDKDFPEKTREYLSPLSSEHLAEICKMLELSPEGSRDARYRRIMREVGYREGWLTRPDPITDSTFTLPAVLPFVKWYPILKRGDYEKDFYQTFTEEMEEIFGHDFVHEQLAIAYGTTLKIDFHLGHPQKPGVGVEFKMPINNSEIQRAIGQLQQYKDRYGSNLVIVLLPDLLTQKAQITFFVEQVAANGIAVVVKE